MVDTRFSVSIQILMTLAYHSDELMNSASLAKVLKTNPTFIRKLVSKLVDAGLIDSYRGKGGGIRLGREPKDISLKDIYLSATGEKPFIKTHQKPVLKACPVSCCIEDVLSDIVSGIEMTTLSYLNKKNLAQLLSVIK